MIISEMTTEVMKNTQAEENDEEINNNDVESC